jgi:mRNA-degrading endonuclease RelE of RelBE toxin-antitoxin system
MNWKIEIKPTAEKQYLRLDKKTRRKIKVALDKLKRDEKPLFHENVRPLTVQLKGDYRLGIGDWRLLFTADKERKVIYFCAILPRGDAY